MTSAASSASPSFEEHRQYFLSILGLSDKKFASARPAQQQHGADLTSRPLFASVVDEAASGGEAPDAFEPSPENAAAADSLSPMSAASGRSRNEDHRRADAALSAHAVEADDGTEIVYLVEAFDEPCKIQNVEHQVNRRVETLMTQQQQKQKSQTGARTPASATRRAMLASLGGGGGATGRRLLLSPSSAKRARSSGAAAAAAAAPTSGAKSTRTLRALSFHSPSRWRHTTAFDIHAFLPADCHVNFNADFPDADDRPRLVTSQRDAARRERRDAKRKLREAHLRRMGRTNGLDSSAPAVDIIASSSSSGDDEEEEEDDDDDAQGKTKKSHRRSASKVSSIDPSQNVNLLEVSRMLAEAGLVIQQLVRALRLQREGVSSQRGGTKYVPPELPRAEQLIELLSRRYSNELLQLHPPPPQQQQQIQHQTARSHSVASSSTAPQGRKQHQQQAVKPAFHHGGGGAASNASSSGATPRPSAVATAAARPRRDSQASRGSAAQGGSYAAMMMMPATPSQQPKPGPPADDTFGNVLDTDGDDDNESTSAQTAMTAKKPAATSERHQEQQQQGGADGGDAAALIASLQETNRSLRAALEQTAQERDVLRGQLSEAVQELVGADAGALRNAAKVRAACEGAIQSLMGQVEALSDKNRRLEARVKELLAANAAGGPHHAGTSTTAKRSVSTASVAAAPPAAARSVSAQSQASNSLAAPSAERSPQPQLLLRKGTALPPSEVTPAAAPAATTAETAAASRSKAPGDAIPKRSPMAVRPANAASPGAALRRAGTATTPPRAQPR